MSLLMQPSHVPMGWVTVGGARLPVYVNPPWLRTISDVVGAVEAIDVSGTQVFLDDDSSGAQGDDAMVIIPGPAGSRGEPGQMGWLMIEEAPGEPDVIMPPGVGQVYGRYTPTLTNVANLDASTAFECVWMRYGSVVTVGGKIDLDPTAAGLVQLGISLPVPSNFTSNGQCAGTAAAPQVAGQCAGITADSTNDRADLRFTAVDLASRSMYFTFIYWVYP